MASREGVDIWLDYDDISCDVYLSDTHQWVLAHIIEIDRPKRNILVKYFDEQHCDEWLNVDSDIYRLCEAGVKSSNHDAATSIDSDGNIVYTQDYQTQMNEFIDAVVNSIHEKYNTYDNNTCTTPPTMNELCSTFCHRWFNVQHSDDISETSMMLPLYDPLTHCAIRVSARGSHCDHASTFDVRSHLEHNIGKQQGRGSEWKCCICNNECLPFDLDCDVFMMNIIHTNNKYNKQSSINTQQLSQFVRKQLELGLSDEFEDRSVHVTAAGTYQLSTDVQLNGRSNKRNSVSIDQVKSKRSKLDDSDCEIVDDDVVTPVVQSATHSIQPDVIDLTLDTHIYDSYIKRIKVKDEKIAFEEKVKHSSHSRQPESLSSPNSFKSLYSVPVCNRVAAGVIALQNQAQQYSINLNAATVKDLTQLPGIGKTTALRIIAYRDERIAKLTQQQSTPSSNTTIKAFNQPSDILSCPKVSYNVLDKLRHLVHC